jgi:hypothetical protein
MSDCIDEGGLRAYLLDRNAMPFAEHAAIEAHLLGCPVCREQMAALSNLSTRLARQLATLAPKTEADSRAAFLRVQERLLDEGAIDSVSRELGFTPWLPQPETHRRANMQTIANRNPRPGMRRFIFSGLLATLILSLLAFPSVRATADQLLQIFRATSNRFVAVEAGRLKQLQAMQFDTSTLFLSSPHFAAGSMQQTKVSTLSGAARLAGFTPEQVSTLPGQATSQRIAVYGTSTVSFTLNIRSLRDVLSVLNISDVTLPDALGNEPIEAVIPPAVVTRYEGSSYSLSLYQGRSPKVTLPAGVDLAELGRAGLRVLGMEPAAADALSKQIDWRSTLVVPFPTGLSYIKQVQVGNVSGLLVRASAIDGLQSRLSGGNAADHTLLYWQRGERFYVIDAQGGGVSESALLIAADSVK